ncbi:MAG: porin family protein [Alphaproteobacteria bacterium]|nr:porin family protein [Alphaproteobacteria bacterium]
MKTKFIAFALCLMPMMANAAIPYRVEQIRMPADERGATLHDAEAFARDHRFYVGAMYDFSMWQGGTGDNNVHVDGKNTSSYEAVVGMRIYDTFRIEANYIRTDAKWNAFSVSGDTAMINVLVDARVDSMYRLFRTQRLVPYVGIGGGLSWNRAHDVHMDDKISPVAAAMAGLGVELGEYFALDFGYRYLYMFDPKFDVVTEFAPTAHQFRVGARVNF